ncbi:MAG: flagellar biosynthesis protein FlhB [Granulosicoccus sp.]
MAEESSGQERTEKATPKRLADARKKGDVPRSRELNTVLMLLASVSGFAVLGSRGVQSYKNLAISQWQISRVHIFSDEATLNALYFVLIEALWISAPFLFLMFIAAFIGPLVMGGWVFSLNSLKVDLKKLSPISGVKRMFGVQGLVELIKALLKVMLLGGVSVVLFRMFMDDFLTLSLLPLGDAVNKVFVIAFIITMTLVVTLGFVAVVDVPFQIWNHAKKLRMTVQEVREESKEQQGNPEVKAKIRQMQQANANRKMMQDVPTADVIIVNPTHFSVALRYEPDSEAPLLVAKGIDHMALKIREVAEVSDVMIFSSPVLARALYHHCDVGETIPPELYLAVAQVLAYVLQVKEANFTVEPPTDIPVPVQFQTPKRM